MQFVCVFFNICRKFEFLISRGSVATFLRWDGYCHMGFVANFMRFPAVQKFWKSVNIWQSYSYSLKVETFFWDTVYNDMLWKKAKEYLPNVRNRRQFYTVVRCVRGLRANQTNPFDPPMNCQRETRTFTFLAGCERGPNSANQRRCQWELQHSDCTRRQTCGLSTVTWTINGPWYRNVLLHRDLLPRTISILGLLYTFRQDNASVCRGRENNGEPGLRESRGRTFPALSVNNCRLPVTWKILHVQRPCYTSLFLAPETSSCDIPLSFKLAHVFNDRQPHFRRRHNYVDVRKYLINKPGVERVQACTR